MAFGTSIILKLIRNILFVCLFCLRIPKEQLQSAIEMNKSH